jgi:signal transduction histidine kinase
MGPLHVDSGGRTWIAPIQGGLRWLKEGKSGVVTADGIANDVVYSIAGTGKDDVWVGRQQGGLTHLRYSGDSFTAKTYTQADRLAQNSVYAVHRSRNGTVWSGTLISGVSELKNGHFTNYTTRDGLAANTISSIAEGPDGTMWFGTPKGVSAMSQKGWRTYTGNDGLPSEDVNCLLQDSTRILWIGTAEGLAYLSGEHVYVPRGAPESLHAPIFGIEADKNGWLWIATSDHVLRVPRDKLLSGVVKAVDVREYDQADGLESTEGVKRSRSVVSDSAGRIWFSLSRGLSVVNPSQINDNSVPALPHIEAITADNNPANLAASIRIPPSPRRITFEYTGLSLVVPGRIRFRYFLEGFDSSWSQPVAAREAVYTNLGPGSYRFRLVASNSEGLWNGPETAIALNVAPAYYQTYWFRLSSIAAFLGMLAAAYQLRLRQLSREFNLRLEERVNERTRIARELHDTLLQSFQGVLLRFQTVSNLLSWGEPKQKLDEAIDQAAQAITEGRDAVQGLRSSTAVTNDLASAICALSDELGCGDTNPNCAEFDVEVEGAPRNLHPILRDEVYRIAGEAVRNAFKHAQAERVEVEIRYDERQLRVRVRDDGKGIDPKLLKVEGRAGHFGLRGMRERAKLMGGKLAVWSELNAGTEVELRIPASRAYETSTGRRRSWLAEKLKRKLAKKDTEAKS